MLSIVIRMGKRRQRTYCDTLYLESKPTRVSAKIVYPTELHVRLAAEFEHPTNVHLLGCCLHWRSHAVIPMQYRAHK